MRKLAGPYSLSQARLVTWHGSSGAAPPLSDAVAVGGVISGGAVPAQGAADPFAQLGRQAYAHAASSVSVDACRPSPAGPLAAAHGGHRAPQAHLTLPLMHHEGARGRDRAKARGAGAGDAAEAAPALPSWRIPAAGTGSRRNSAAGTSRHDTVLTTRQHEDAGDARDAASEPLHLLPDPAQPRKPHLPLARRPSQDAGVPRDAAGEALPHPQARTSAPLPTATDPHHLGATQFERPSSPLTMQSGDRSASPARTAPSIASTSAGPSSMDVFQMLGLHADGARVLGHQPRSAPQQQRPAGATRHASFEHSRSNLSAPDGVHGPPAGSSARATPTRQRTSGSLYANDAGAGDPPAHHSAEGAPRGAWAEGGPRDRRAGSSARSSHTSLAHLLGVARALTAEESSPSVMAGDTPANWSATGLAGTAAGGRARRTATSGRMEIQLKPSYRAKLVSSRGGLGAGTRRGCWSLRVPVCAGPSTGVHGAMYAVAAGGGAGAGHGHLWRLHRRGEGARQASGKGGKGSMTKLLSGPRAWLRRRNLVTFARRRRTTWHPTAGSTARRPPGAWPPSCGPAWRWRPWWSARSCWRLARCCWRRQLPTCAAAASSAT